MPPDGGISPKNGESIEDFGMDPLDINDKSPLLPNFDLLRATPGLLLYRLFSRR